MTAPDLFLLNARAGKHVGPYPHELPAPFDIPRCANPGCGNPLTGDLTNNGLPRRYCGPDCRRAHTSRLQFARMEAARQEKRLALSPYNWD